MILCGRIRQKAAVKTHGKNVYFFWNRQENQRAKPNYLCCKRLYMKTTLFFAITFWLLASPPPVYAQMNFFPEELIVQASVLNLRDKPDKSGKVLEKLLQGATLTLVEAVNDGEYVEVDSAFGVWLKVRSVSKMGYVFSPHVIGAYNLYQEGDVFDNALPKLNWYGVYMRDSFADEIRKIDVRLDMSYHELFGDSVPMLKTNQPTTAKFIIGTSYTFKPGLAGPLGAYDPGTLYISGELPPGAMLPIYPGTEINDTLPYSTYFLAATGCAQFEDSDYVRVRDYRLYAYESSADGYAPKQDLTGWVQAEEGMNPSINMVWFGDLDGDRKPDVILQDTPQESAVRISLFLSSKARTGEYIHKVCEYFYTID